MQNDKKPIPMREAYGNALVKLGEDNKDVVVFEADVGGSTRSILFGNRFPERYFNVGIAELNMTAMAAGMSTQGFMPWVNTFAVFLATRGSDPIQSLICYDNMNVKLVGAYCGMSDSFDGASHNSITDISFMRSLPNMTVISPCDPVETEKAVFAAAEYRGPVYIRLSRSEVPYIFNDDYKFEIGKGKFLKDGSDVTIVATGYMVHKALEAAQNLEKQGISAAVLDIHTIKPLDNDLILKYAEKTKAIVTAEEHSIYGGLGSAVAELLAENMAVPMGRIGIRQFGESGAYEALLTKYEMDAVAVEHKVKEILCKKKV